MYAKPLVITRTLNCSKRQLFDAWSKAEILSKWFFASPTKIKDSLIENNFHLGGSWSLTMYFEDGSDAQMHGEYKEIIRYTTIIFTWNSTIAKDSLVALTFKEISPNRSSLKLVHSQLISDESKDMHNRGWNACLENLEKYTHNLANI